MFGVWGAPESTRDSSHVWSPLPSFRLLGPVEADVEGHRVNLGRPQERLLLGLLLLAAGRPVPVDRLVGLLWPERPPRAPRQVVQTYICRLRAALASAGGGHAAGLVTRCGDAYAANVSSDTVDVHRFARMVGSARCASDPVERSRLLSEALSLWRGPLLAGLASDRLRHRVGAQVEALRDLALRCRVEADLAAGRHAELVGELAARLADDPLDEGFAGYLMLALYRSGRRAAALAVYRETRTRIADELGLEPSEQLRDLERAILRAEASSGLGQAHRRTDAWVTFPLATQVSSPRPVRHRRVGQT